VCVRACVRCVCACVRVCRPARTVDSACPVACHLGRCSSPCSHQVSSRLGLCTEERHGDQPCMGISRMGISPTALPRGTSAWWVPANHRTVQVRSGTRTSLSEVARRRSRRARGAVAGSLAPASSQPSGSDAIQDAADVEQPEGRWPRPAALRWAPGGYLIA
jgi:hypothetical protein